MSSCSVLRAIEQVEQQLANFLSTPAAFTATQRNRIAALIESVRGAVRELPLAAGPRADILNRLGQAVTLLGSTTLTALQIISAVLQILAIVTLKVQNRRICCSQGIVTVVPSCKFSTACSCC